jgi:hypothetical protein
MERKALTMSRKVDECKPLPDTLRTSISLNVCTRFNANNARRQSTSWLLSIA